jgi:hypothetical protein
MGLFMTSYDPFTYRPHLTFHITARGIHESTSSKARISDFLHNPNRLLPHVARPIDRRGACNQPTLLSYFHLRQDQFPKTYSFIRR